MSSIEIRVGANVWFEGALWQVDEVTGRGVRIRKGATMREVGVGAFSEAAVINTEELPAESEDPLGILITALTDKQLAKLKAMEEPLLSLLQAEAEGGEASARALYAETARKLGISERTLWRRMAAYKTSGIAGLADSRTMQKYDSRVDPRWDAACVQVLDAAVYASTPTRDAVIRRVNAEVARVHGEGVVPAPGKTAAYRRLNELAKGRHSFGSGRGRRSVAERPEGVYGRLNPSYPGEYVLLDTTPLDVFAMEPVTGRWVPTELTVAIDLFSRCILGLRLSPVSTKSGDVANVLFQVVRPPAGDDAGDGFPYHGVPKNVLVPGGEEALDRGCVPSTVVVDHGKQYVSDHVIGACARLGINVQPAIPHKPTDKPAVERFFRTLRESFLQHLPAYKGPDVYSRGKDIEDQAYLLVTEMEQLIREWVGTVYHGTKHSSLQLPDLPGMFFSPAELFDIGRARTGVLRLPARPELAYEFLQVHWRTIQHYGV
uniref:helix-turn-helix domain-containing protein n=1 Tax=Arthrobacter castelli TaxID=271431 RepID=UPI00068445B4